MKDHELIFGLMTSLGHKEYSFEELKSLTAPFQVTVTSLRTNLSRMVKSEILISKKEGKTALYSLSKKGGRISSNVAFSFKKLDWGQWDGSWWGVLFTVPYVESAQRHSIRKKLLAYRFANLYPGFWIRPMHPNEKIEIHLESLYQDGHCTLIKFDFFCDMQIEDIAGIWKLSEINDSFQQIIEVIRNHLGMSAAYSPEEGLKYKMLVGNEIVNALFADPMLPDVFLPRDWKGEELRLLFREFDETMTAIARPFVQSVFI